MSTDSLPASDSGPGPDPQLRIKFPRDTYVSEDSIWGFPSFERRAPYQSSVYTKFTGRDVSPQDVFHPSVITWQDKWISCVGGVGFVEWPNPCCQTILTSLAKVGSLEGWNCPSIPDKCLYNHVRRLQMTLHFWMVQNSKSARECYQIMVDNLTRGPDYAEALDEHFKLSLRISRGVLLSDTVPTNAEIIGSIDEIFPACHLIPFKMEDPQDWKLGLDIEESSPDFDYDLFKEVVKEHTQNTFITEDAFDLDDLSGTTKSWIGHPDNKMLKIEALDKIPLGCFSEPDVLEYSYTPVQKSACELRAACTPSLKTLHCQQMALKELKRVFKASNDCMEKTNLDFVSSWLSQDNCLYLMVDQRKCGITFPKKLIIATLEAILELYPHLKWTRAYLRAYKRGIKLYAHGKWYLLNRGVVLGMMNELVSFSMSILYFTFLRKEGISEDGQWVSLFWNDDQVLRVPEESGDLYSLLESWSDFMRQAGCLVHETKSFGAKSWGVFLETYPASYKDTKWTQYYGNIYYALFAPNKFAAKTYVASVVEFLKDLISTPEADPVSEVISILGYEFSHDEINYSYPIGWTLSPSWRDNYTSLVYDLEMYVYKHPSFLNVLALGPPPIKTRIISKDAFAPRKNNSLLRNKSQRIFDSISNKYANDRISAFNKPAGGGIRLRDYIIPYVLNLKATLEGVKVFNSRLKNLDKRTINKVASLLGWTDPIWLDDQRTSNYFRIYHEDGDILFRTYLLFKHGPSVYTAYNQYPELQAKFKEYLEDSNNIPFTKDKELIYFDGEIFIGSFYDEFLMEPKIPRNLRFYLAYVKLKSQGREDAINNLSAIGELSENKDENPPHVSQESFVISDEQMREFMLDVNSTLEAFAKGILGTAHPLETPKENPVLYDPEVGWYEKVSDDSSGADPVDGFDDLFG